MVEQHGKTLVPQIRFAGFTDPWEQRKLGEVAPLQRGFDLPVSQMISGPYPVVMSNGVGGWHSKYAVKGPGVVTGRSGTIGGLQYIEGDFWPHNTSLWVTSFNGNEPKFIYWLYSSLNLERFGSGSGVPTLNRNDVHDQLIGVPCNIAEQRRIGAFFDRLDSLITLHQRKYDKLCVLKKSMLDKMFPKGGSLYPEIRFAGFTDPWEQRKLGELFEESDERASDREILSVSVANGIYPASESDRETNPGASLANYKIVHFGDVVYNSMRMWQGAVDASRYDGIVSPAYVVARPNSEVYARFFARLLRQPMLLKQYQQVSQGNSKDTQVLKFDDFASIGISMPASENEQCQIGAFFDRLDSLITLHQRKLELLRNIKKSMLDKMFV
ncbi:restriction endonuclease subunit S [Bifidobacterium catenulatum]|uniref:restriction endonuclease subunit S n=2 Tax=Bifidobacterium TaxID=1678 RepID=UPI0034A3F403